MKSGQLFTSVLLLVVHEKVSSSDSSSSALYSYNPTCSIYMAPSSIPNSGFGVFTTQHIRQYEPVYSNFLTDAPSIPVFDPNRHISYHRRYHHHHHSNNSSSNNDYNNNSNNNNEENMSRNWAHVEYFWSGDGHVGFEATKVEDNVVTLGSLCNYHPFLYNIKPVAGSYDDSFLQQTNRSNPGTGAFSYYQGYSFMALHDILPGEELFADYGVSWLDTREGTFADLIPRKEDYQIASQVLHKILLATMKKNKKKKKQERQQQQQQQEQDQQQRMKNQEEQRLTMDPHIIHSYDPLQDETFSLIQDVVSVFNPRISSLLPQSQAQYEELISSISAIQNHNKNKLDRILALSTIHPRNVTWIEEHGMCLDNLVPQPSTLGPHAGMGAFAQRFLPKDSRIVPSPLLQIPDRSTLLMYPLDPSFNEVDEEAVGNDPHSNRFSFAKEPKSAQLLLNYCFGHPDMTMLLCPSSNAILINHCSGRKDGLFQGQCAVDQGPNAQIIWADDWDPLTTEWRHFTIDTIDQLTENSMRGLSFDFIALRDIQPGEEVFIDYGEEWEKSWEYHQATWKPSIHTKQEDNIRTETYKSVFEMNLNLQNELKTMSELIDHPYPDNVQTVCIYDEPTNKDDDDADDDTRNDIIVSSSLGRFTDDVALYDIDYDAKDIIMTNNGMSFSSEYHSRWADTHWPCQIIEKRGDASYTVRILSASWEDPTPWSRRNQARLVSNYPIGSIKFVTKKYKSDVFLPGVFRHYIQIPDNMISEEWRVLEESISSSSDHAAIIVG